MRSGEISLAKITRPKFSRVLLRKRLFSMLDKSRSHPAVWVSGPPGAGKTVLISTYIEEARGLLCIWYQADSGDADVSTFFHYMGLAAKKVSPRNKKPLPIFSPEYLSATEAFAKRYFECLFTRLKPPFCIVIDNYHEISTDSMLHGLLCKATDTLPEGGSIIFVGRGDPPAEMARLRAGNAMKAVEADDLLLTTGESQRLMRLRLQARFSTKLVQEVHHRTGGWAAGIVLITERLKKGELDLRRYELVAMDTIFDYFNSEILKGLDEDTQRFLMKTAIMPVMTPKMAEDLTGVNNAGWILSHLNRNNCLTERHPLDEQVYQYHPLFREFLLTCARDSFSSKDLTEMRRKAAALLETSDRIEDTVGLLKENCDWGAIGAIIIRYAPVMLQHGRGQTLCQWLASIPKEMLNINPYLLYWLGVSIMPYNQVESRHHYEEAFELFKGEGDKGGMLLACSGVIDAILFQLATPKLLDRWIPIAHELLRDCPAFPSQEMEARIKSSIFRGLMIRQPQHPEMGALAKGMLAVSQAAPDINLRMLGYIDVAFYYLFTGQLAKAFEVIAPIQHLAQSRQVSPMVLTMFRDVEAQYYMLTGMHESCLKSVFNGLKIAETTGVYIWRYNLITHGLASALSNNDLSTADRLMEDMSSISEEDQRLSVTYHHCMAVWYFICRGDRIDALAHQRAALESATDLGMPFIEAISHFGIAQVCFELGEHKNAKAHLAHAGRIGRRMRSHMFEFMYLLMTAQFTLSDKPETVTSERKGLGALRKAMSLGREEGYVNCYWWRPSVMARLCCEALQAGIETGYVQDLIRKRNLFLEIPHLDVEDWPWHLKVHTFGRFSFVRNDMPILFPKKVQRKPLDLLNALIALGGREVSEEQLAEILWPEADGDVAHNAFKITLHRLRRLTGDVNSVAFKNRKVTLEGIYWWVDAWAFERTIEKAEAVLKEGRKKESIGLFERVVSLYRGPFLAGDHTIPQIASYGDKLRNRFLNSVNNLGRLYEEIGEFEKAIETFKRGIETDAIAEEFYQHLIASYQRLGRKAEAIAIYNRLKKALHALLGIAPSPETEAIYRSLVSK